jgi:cytochrome c553
MATGAAPDGGATAHHGNGHGALACTTCHDVSFQGIRAPAIAGLPQATILAGLAHHAGPTGHNAMMRLTRTKAARVPFLSILLML